VSPSSEEREFAVLVGELHALEKDIAGARAASARAHDRMDFITPPASPPRAVEGERVEVSDGDYVMIRPVEPHDAPVLEIGLEHLSAMSRYRRYRTRAKQYRRDELDAILRTDHDQREAVGAFDCDTGHGLGIARYVRDPHDKGQADVTYLVSDEWQHRGVGGALLAHLAERARAAGIERLTATILVGDEAGRRLLAEVAEPIEEHRDGGVLEVTARLRPAP
jgi:GNAT superfamily N-acetyltransferase